MIVTVLNSSKHKIPCYMIPAINLAILLGIIRIQLCITLPRATYCRATYCRNTYNTVLSSKWLYSLVP